MAYLLDTNAFIWWATDDKKLGSNAISVLQTPGVQVFVSDVVLLELSVKLQTGKLRLNVSPREIEQACLADKFEEISFDFWAAQAFLNLSQLSWNDPFDWAHMALAEAKQLTLVTSDESILKSGAVRCMDARL